MGNVRSIAGLIPLMDYFWKAKNLYCFKIKILIKTLEPIDVRQLFN